MSTRDQISLDHDLLSFMENAEGDVVPHKHSTRQIAPSQAAIEAATGSDPPPNIIDNVREVTSRDRVSGHASSHNFEDQPTAANDATDVAARQKRRRERRRAEREQTRNVGKSTKRRQTDGAIEALAAPLAPELHYLSVRQVARRFGVGIATIWRWCGNNPNFPKPIRPGPGATRWPLEEILAFERSLKERR